MKKTVIYPNINSDKDLLLTEKVALCISGMGQKAVVSEKYRERLCHCSSVSFENDDTLFDSACLVIALGGDGTILHLSHIVSPLDIPVLGINLGKVGFMAELEKEETDLISKFYSGDFKLEERMMLDVDIISENGTERSFNALNDAVISNGNLSKMVQLDLKYNDNYITTYRADGIILSTPTGSTAYSLSAGGPIIDPLLHGICATPVCPHSFFNARPLIFSENASIEISDISGYDSNGFLTIDGFINVELMENDRVKIKKSAVLTKLVRIKKTEFYEILYDKLSERKNK